MNVNNIKFLTHQILNAQQILKTAFRENPSNDWFIEEKKLKTPVKTERCEIFLPNIGQKLLVQLTKVIALGNHEEFTWKIEEDSAQ